MRSSVVQLRVQAFVGCGLAPFGASCGEACRPSGRMSPGSRLRGCLLLDFAPKGGRPHLGLRRVWGKRASGRWALQGSRGECPGAIVAAAPSWGSRGVLVAFPGWAGSKRLGRRVRRPGCEIKEEDPAAGRERGTFASGPAYPSLRCRSRAGGRLPRPSAPRRSGAGRGRRTSAPWPGRRSLSSPRCALRPTRQLLQPTETPTIPLLSALDGVAAKEELQKIHEIRNRKHVRSSGHRR